MVFIRPLIVLLSLNLLVSQCGLNVYALYCCCTKSLAYSVIPKQDHCGTGHKKSCQAHPSEGHGFKKAPCKNHLVERLSLESRAQKPNEDILQFNSLVASVLQILPISEVAMSAQHSNTVYLSEYVLSSQERLKMFCLRLC